MSGKRKSSRACRRPSRHPELARCALAHGHHATQFSAAFRKRRDSLCHRKATPRAFLEEASDDPYLSPLFPTFRTSQVEWGCGDARNVGRRNPRHSALQGMARTRRHDGGGSSDLCNSIRSWCPGLRMFLDTIGQPDFRRTCYNRVPVPKEATRYPRPDSGIG